MLIEGNKLLTEINIKQKKWESYGKEWINSRHFLLNVITGFMWILLGLAAVDKHFVWNDLDVRVFIGLGFIALGFIGIRNHVIIVKQDSIFINGDDKSFDFKPDKILLTEINSGKLIFTNGKKKISVSTDRFTESEIDDIKMKFGDKL